MIANTEATAEIDAPYEYDAQSPPAAYYGEGSYYPAYSYGWDPLYGLGLYGASTIFVVQPPTPPQQPPPSHNPGRGFERPSPEHPFRRQIPDGGDTGAASTTHRAPEPQYRGGTPPEPQYRSAPQPAPAYRAPENRAPENRVPAQAREAVHIRLTAHALERHAPTEQRVFGQVDGGHAAGAELGDDAITREVADRGHGSATGQASSSTT